MVIFIDKSGIHKQTGHAASAVVYVEVEELEKFENKLKRDKKLRRRVILYDAFYPN